MKMYIIVRYDLPDQFVPVVAAHASLACYRKFERDEDMQKWVNGVFKKVVCVASDTEFQKLKEIDKNLVLTESALGNEEVCVVFCPREDFPKIFKFLPMWKPTLQ